MSETVIPLAAETETFYVPAFEVRIANQRLPRDVVRDVIELTYEDNIEKVDSFSLTINNWDATERRLKYTGPETAPAPNSDAGRLATLFDPGKELQIHLGYQGANQNLRLMMTGYITTLEPAFSESSAPTLTVRGLNVLDRFRRRQYTWAWQKPQDRTKDSEIARQLSRAPDDRAGRPGLDCEVRPVAEAEAAEESQAYVFMNNQYPILFLLERARRRGYSVFIVEETRNGQPHRYLHFGPSPSLRDVTYELEWGRSLVQFRPTLTTTRQLKKVIVRGWNRRTNRPIEGVAELSQNELNSDLHALARDAGREEVITDQPVHSVQEARELAQAILRRQLQDFVKATGTTVGLPDLRAGRAVVLKGLGYRFNGRYFVTQTSHTFNDSGYRTTFHARREQTRAASAGAPAS